MTFYSKTNSGR